MTSTSDIFKLANQSVDELLREISKDTADHRSVPSSPTTEPLKIEDVNKHDNDSIMSESFQGPVVPAFNGLRALDQSPIKKSSVVAFEPQVITIGNDELFDRPLPLLKPSESDYSVKSMPNLPSSSINLLDSPSAHSNNSQDSERTIAVDEKRSATKNLQKLLSAEEESAAAPVGLAIQKTRGAEPTAETRSRHVSLQSTATSLNESDFVSADEGNSSDFEPETVDSDATVEMDENANDTTANDTVQSVSASFDDDPYKSFEVPEARNVSSSSRETATEKKRVSSAESAGKNDILAIWSSQEDYQKVRRTPTSFQSICDPKKYTVREKSFKQIKVASPVQPKEPAEESRDETDADDEDEDEDDSPVTPNQSVEKTFNNPLDSMHTDTDVSKNVSNMSNLSMGSIHLSDVLNEGDDSFLKDLEAWEPQSRVEPVITKASNVETLSNVWRRGTLSKKPVSSKTDVESVKFPHMSAGEVEQFMILKKMASDEFQIKEANNKLTLESNTLHREQHVTVGDARSDITADDKVSTIVPDLSIATGPIEEPAKPVEPVVPPTAHRYGDLVPAARREVNRAEPASSIRTASQRISSAISSSTKAEVEKPLVLGEYGRFFLRVMGLRELKLPEIAHRNAKFQIVLDNSIHRLTTDYFPIESAGFVPVNKEFELVVADALDIVMTLKIKYDKPKAQLVEVTDKRKVKPKNVFAKMLGYKDIVTSTRYVTKPAEKDPLAELVAADGSFAKFFISFANFEHHVTGESKIFKLDGMNEWRSSNDKSKPAVPYKVCAADFNMLFVPRTSEYETLPISIKNAYDMVAEVRNTLSETNEGYMYQEGGDVEVWSRRFFKLQGYDLCAHNDTTFKLKARINLKRVVDVEYVGKEDTAGSKRVYSDRLLLNNSFKLRFANGETIYFGCDSKEEKTRWVELLETIGAQNSFMRQPWVKLMASKVQ
ncbi:hypothetical protein OGAPHI_005271 [Ogataea philodendri]|uniref:PH domain-containing protein n=1 Tax=Ogataea philodendri TaxID=1378263 RepID=A0A9P8P1L8_9ASCO|nr:uncharacterized protein OGAPHI_005271 [Ogataea philodendri]KAH3663868.1 hypothetical protein OGAPHI_005271 [Ogataea philodendri]